MILTRNGILSFSFNVSFVCFLFVLNFVVNGFSSIIVAVIFVIRVLMEKDQLKH